MDATQSEKKDKPQEPKEITIIVNTRQKTVSKEELTFQQIVDLAFPPGTTQAVTFTVDYHRAHGNKGGSLLEGESVKVKEGTIFDVTATNQS